MLAILSCVQLLIVMASVILAQELRLDWQSNFYSRSNNSIQSFDVRSVLDSQGNTISLFYYNMDSTITDGQNKSNITSSPLNTTLVIQLIKFDKLGNFIWRYNFTSKINGTNLAYSKRLLDYQNNVYLLLNVIQNTSLTSQNGTEIQKFICPLQALQCVYLIKFDKDGNLKFTQRSDGVSAFDLTFKNDGSYTYFSYYYSNISVYNANDLTKSYKFATIEYFSTVTLNFYANGSFHNGYYINGSGDGFVYKENNGDIVMIGTYNQYNNLLYNGSKGFFIYELSQNEFALRTFVPLYGYNSTIVRLNSTYKQLWGLYSDGNSSLYSRFEAYFNSFQNQIMIILNVAPTFEKIYDQYNKTILVMPRHDTQYFQMLAFDQDYKLIWTQSIFSDASYLFMYIYEQHSDGFVLSPAIVNGTYLQLVNKNGMATNYCNNFRATYGCLLKFSFDGSIEKSYIVTGPQNQSCATVFLAYDYITNEEILSSGTQCTGYQLIDDKQKVLDSKQFYLDYPNNNYNKPFGKVHKLSQLQSQSTEPEYSFTSDQSSESTSLETYITQSSILSASNSITINITFYYSSTYESQTTSQSTTNLQSSNQDNQNGQLSQSIIYIIASGAGFVGLVLFGVAIFVVRRKGTRSSKLASANRQALFSQVSTKNIKAVQSSYNTETYEMSTMYSTQTPLSIPAFMSYRYGLDYVQTSYVAKGGNSVIYMANVFNQDLRKRIGNNSVIIKYINNSEEGLAEKEKISFYQELSLCYKYINNDSFAQLYAYSDIPATILMKYYKYGTLKNFIHSNQFEQYYSQRQVLVILERFCKSIRCMHQDGFVHLDIKPENVMLDFDEQAQLFFPVLSDFGISRIYDKSQVLVRAFELSTIRGISVSYAAPETFLYFRRKNSLTITENDLVTMADIYSISIMIFEILTRSKPYVQTRK